MNTPDRDTLRRRMMFVASEDYYFLSYTLLLTLSELRLPLVEPKKVALMADFIGSDHDMLLLETTSRLSVAAQSRLGLLYDRAISRRLPLQRVLHALEMRSWICVTRTSGQPDEVLLMARDEVLRALESPIYSQEKARIRRIRSLYPRLRTMTLSTLRERVFDRKGVRTWDE